MTNNCNITHRSSLGLLPDNVLADLSNINPGVSFFQKNKYPDISKDLLDGEPSILLEQQRDTTFKIPLPRPIQSSEDTSTMSPKNLSMKYLRPNNNDLPRNDSAQPSSPSVALVDERIASFAAKNTSLNEMSTREVDWSNLFERIGVQKDNPIVRSKDVPRNAENNIRTCKQDTHLGTPSFSSKLTDEKSFSIEALSISMANRPRSTSFGGSPHEGRNELASTRMEGFSDYTNPPGSNFGCTAINDTKANSKIKDISYLEDSVFAENPLAAKMEPPRNMQFSLGPFPSQSEFPETEFEANSFVSNNLDFINQAEAEFAKDHRFDQFDISNSKNPSKTNNDREFITNSVLTINDDIQEDGQEQADKLSASAYFAMSTSRLGSLEKAPVSDANSSHSTNMVNRDDVEGRPNLGFSRIVSPKRKPISVHSMDNNDKSLKPKNLLDPKLPQYHNNERATSSGSTRFSNTRESQRSSLVTDVTFKIPMLPNEDNKKDTHTLPRTRKNTTKSRHSSPIKRDQEQVKENIAPTVKENHVRLLNSFPVDIDKVRLSWLAVGVNKTEEKWVRLRNITDRELGLRLIIRESNQFTFKQTTGVASNGSSLTGSQPIHDQYIDTVLQGNETKDVVVNFSPLSCPTGQIKGKLVIKPKGMGGSFIAKGIKGGNIKASIPLCGYVGTPKIEFDDSFKATVGHFSNHFTAFIGTMSSNSETSKETLIYNRGDGSAFVRLQTFADINCRVACGHENNDPIRVEPNAFILNPGCSRNITIFVRPSHGSVEGQHTCIGSMLVISGPEICRQAVCRKKMDASNKRYGKRYLVRGVDFDVPFQGENEFITAGGMLEEPLNGDEESEFEMKMTTTSVNIMGLVQSKAQFVRLQVEETMSESRINCTVLGGSLFESAGDAATRQTVRNYDTIKEEEEIQIPPKSHCYTSHKSDKMESGNKQMLNSGVKKSPSKNNGTEVFKLKSSKLFFPPVKVGNTCVEKLIMENHTKKNISVAIESISSPFKTNHNKFEVKSKSYLKIPIIYSPDDAGKHKGKVLLKSDCGRQLDAVLIGDSLKSDIRAK